MRAYAGTCMLTYEGGKVLAKFFLAYFKCVLKVPYYFPGEDFG